MASRPAAWKAWTTPQTSRPPIAQPSQRRPHPMKCFVAKRGLVVDLFAVNNLAKHFQPIVPSRNATELVTGFESQSFVQWHSRRRQEKVVSSIRTSFMVKVTSPIDLLFTVSRTMRLYDAQLRAKPPRFFFRVHTTEIQPLQVLKVPWPFTSKEVRRCIDESTKTVGFSNLISTGPLNTLSPNIFGKICLQFRIFCISIVLFGIGDNFNCTRCWSCENEKIKIWLLFVALSIWCLVSS